MINEVSITAKFVTGVTIQDPEKAKEAMKRVLLERLATLNILEIDKGNGIFSVQILNVENEQI